MAKVVDKFTGSLSGQLGDVVYRRYKNGSVFVARKKSYNIVSYSDACIKTRKKFKVAVSFAKAANSLSDIRKIWKNPVYEGRSPYTKILKTNIGLVNENMLPGVRSKITPDGFGLNYEVLSLSKYKVTIKLSLTEFYKSMRNIKFTLNFVVALLNPKQSDNETDFTCVSAESEIILPDYNNFHTIETNFSSLSADTIYTYKDAIVFFSLTNTENSKHIFTSTFSSEFKIEE